MNEDRLASVDLRASESLDQQVLPENQVKVEIRDHPALRVYRARQDHQESADYLASADLLDHVVCLEREDPRGRTDRTAKMVNQETRESRV